MKLVIAGATGLLGSELVHQSLRMPAVSSVVALGRRAVSAPDGANAAKLKNVIVEDFGSYSEDVRREFEGAGACIWYELTVSGTFLGKRDMLGQRGADHFFRCTAGL